MNGKRIAAACLLCMAFLAIGAPAQEKPAANEDAKAALYKKFEEALTDAVLIGSFTTKGEKNDGKLNEERYEIIKVTKAQDDFWLFQARIKYGKHDVTIPLLLEVKWAGDTPVITLDDFLVPGFGSFTARVLIHDNQYVGTWDGGDHGGQMFGRIEKKQKKVDEPAEKNSSKTE